MVWVWKEMPRVFPEQKMWGASDDIWSFIVTEEDGKYSCSVRHEYVYVLKEFEKYDTLEQAKRACEARARR